MLPEPRRRQRHRKDNGTAVAHPVRKRGCTEPPAERTAGRVDIQICHECAALPLVTTLLYAGRGHWQLSQVNQRYGTHSTANGCTSLS